MNLEISLYSLEQAALILLDEGGAHYSNQVGGTMCIQAVTRGVLIPLSNSPPLNADEGAALDVKLATLCQGVTLGEEEADELDLLFEREVFDYTIVIDRAKLTESVESWVYVNISTKCQTHYGFTNASAILTWPNSD